MAMTPNPQGTATLTNTPESGDPFRFRDLPIEIQLNVFQRLLPTGTPEPGATELVESDDNANVRYGAYWNSTTHMVSQFKLPEIGSDIADDESITREQEEASNKQDAFNVLRLDASTFKDFAPHYYQKRSLVFSEPFRFSNEFLSKATDACLYNLRYLTCRLDEKQNHWGRSATSEASKTR